MSDWEQFFATNAPPINFEESKTKLEHFCWMHKDVLIVLVTSGGTTIPLEHNTVRFVDNFSAGTRGAASAEYFLNLGYSVIFLYRTKTMEPFVRHFTGQRFLDTLVIKDRAAAHTDHPDPRIEVSSEYTHRILPILRRYKAAKHGKRLMCIDFTSLSDYLWLLREACHQLAGHRFNALLYLAAAVSDFYIPAHKIPEHKMQSAEGPPSIQLSLVPKMLGPLVSEWVPEAFVVSFKLETDARLLLAKAKKALDTYKHNLVIGNILDSRKYKVTVVEPMMCYDIQLIPEEMARGLEIEEKIVLDLSRRHNTLIRVKLANMRSVVHV